MKADLAGSEAEYEDTLVKQLQDSMRRVKRSRKMGERYMMFEQYMKEYVQEHADEIREEAREEGLAEGRAEGQAEMARLNKLYASLLASGRSSDLQRALDDPEYLKQLLEKTGS